MGADTVAQDSLPKNALLSDVKAFIRGQEGKQTIDIDLLRAGFDIELSDTSYSVSRLRVCWEDKRDNIVCMAVHGNHIDTNNTRYSLRDAQLTSIVSFDAITVTRDGKEYRLPSFFVNTADLFNKYLTLRNPQICHDKELRPICYNDGTYTFQFEDSKFSGFVTADSSILYNEKAKTITIKKLRTSSGLVADPIVLKLGNKSLICTSGNTVVPVNEINSFFTHISGLNIKMKTGRFEDTIHFRVSDQHFTVMISKNDLIWPKIGWRWEIIEKHAASTFAIRYNLKNNNPASIFIQDDRLQYGMAISTSFKSGKRIWSIESLYIEEIDNVVSYRPLAQKYRYTYTKDGRLNSKKSFGKVLSCGCL